MIRNCQPDYSDGRVGVEWVLDLELVVVAAQTIRKGESECYPTLPPPSSPPSPPLNPSTKGMESDGGTGSRPHGGGK